jgi:hypothetical protein
VIEETIRTIKKDLTGISNGLGCKSMGEDGSFEAC